MLAPRIPAPKKRAAAVDPYAALGLAITGGGDGLGKGQGGLAIHDDIGDLSQIGTTNGQGVGGGFGMPSYAPPSLKLQALSTQGPIDNDVVDRTLKRSRARLMKCFADELQKTGASPGIAKVQMVIDAKGKVKNVNAVGNANACVQTTILAMGNFPPPPDDAVTVVTVVLTYDPGTQITGNYGGHSGGRQLRAKQAPSPAPAPKPVAKVPPIPDTRSWTPYAASVGLASDDVAQAAGDELVKLMPLAKLETCFAGKNASERTIVTIAFDGGVIGARSGGSGDAQVDACISASLIGLEVGAPPTVSEISCDIVRGDVQPWRVAPESYTVIEVSDKEIKEGGVALTRQTLVPANADATHSFLIVVDPAAPPALLAAAFERTAWSAATLVALKSDAGSPVFIGMGRDGRTREKDYAPLIAIAHDKDSVKSCISDEARGTAPKAEVQTLLQTLASSCDPKPCPATLSIALGGTMQDLAADADAARRAGLPRIGLSTTGCP